MRAVDLIEKKRNGLALHHDEIEFLITGYVRGVIPDYQMSAFLMAVCFRGMSVEETADLTMCMMRSGDVLDLSDIPGRKVDKHSTGGVGDTTTLIVAPLVAACGGRVAKISGRGLGHTGGTIDKLESIPGFSASLPIERFKKQVEEIGLALAGQSERLVPADKKMYALRDVTATARSVPLIASSIMSKKLAAGADAILLDVKVGTGALMQTLEEARELASLMVGIGKRLDRRVMAVITDMNQPLGMAVGNALEVREAVQTLSGQRAAGDPLYEVCMLLGGYMLLMGGIAKDMEQARGMLTGALQSGAGLKKLQAMAAAQGGEARWLTPEKIDGLCDVKKRVPVLAEAAGRITGMHAALIGEAAQILGAGRAEQGDVIDPAVGILMQKRTGDTVAAGDVLCTLYVNDETNVERAKALLREAVIIGVPHQPAMVYEVME